MPSVKYLLRLAEFALVSGLSSGGAILLADDAAFGKAALLSALAAGGVTAYGVLVKGLGDYPDRPSVN